MTKLEKMLQVGNRWTKGENDRVYFSAYDVLDYKFGKLNGEKVSKAYAWKLENTKCYYDVNTDELVVFPFTQSKSEQHEIEKLFTDAIEKII